MVWYKRDFVTINDGGNDEGSNDVASAGPYCGKNKPPKYKSSEFGVRMHFISDGSKTRGGFKAKYKCTVPRAPTKAPPVVCGGSLYGPKGRFL